MQHVLQMRNPGADCHNYHSLFPVHHHGQAQGEGSTGHSMVEYVENL